MLRATYFSTVDDGLASYRSRLFKGIYMGTKVAVKRAVDEEVFVPTTSLGEDARTNENGTPMRP